MLPGHAGGRLMAYAESTTVPVERSKSELKRVIYKYEASNYQFAETDDKAMVQFVKNAKLIRFVISFPAPDDSIFTRTPTGRSRTQRQAVLEYEQEFRRRWRAMILSVKGKFETVESGIETFEEAFLAHIVLPDNRTMATVAIPQIEEAYQTKKMPKLLEIGTK